MKFDGRALRKLIRFILSRYKPDRQDQHKAAKLPYLVHEETQEQD